MHRESTWSFKEIKVLSTVIMHKLVTGERQNINMSVLLNTYTSPVVIGGIGGSGTRLIAQCLRDLGFFLGIDLNESNDNLWFTLLFKRIEILSATDDEFDELTDIFYKGMTGSSPLTTKQIELINGLALQDRKQYSVNWLRQRIHSLLSNQVLLNQFTKWGWKEPNSHIVLDRLRIRFKDMKYIHVVRNGLDMAYSKNQSQLELWGGHFIGNSCKITPYNSLKYWCNVHRRVLDIGKSMGTDFLFLNYDDFCLNPENGIKQLCDFIGVVATNIQTHDLAKIIRLPKTIGRFKQYGINNFDKKDVTFVEQLGFDIGNK
jgi:hypothetical protein